MGGCFDRLSTRTKAAYRLLENPALDWRVVLEMHAGRTEERIIQYRPKIALCLQDTSELDFSSQPGIAGLGRLNFDARRGLYIHPTLVVTPEGLALGVTDAWMWARPPKGEAEFKESIRWPEGYERVAEMATRVPDTRLVYIADREGDLRELMDRAHQLDYPADYLVRAVHERNTAEGDKLWECVAASQALGEIEFVLPATPGRPARGVCQTIYVQRLTLPPRGNAPAIEVTALLAQEENPPVGEPFDKLRASSRWCGDS